MGRLGLSEIEGAPDFASCHWLIQQNLLLDVAAIVVAASIRWSQKEWSAEWDFCR
jgi:hypothetical protein